MEVIINFIEGCRKKKKHHHHLHAKTVQFAGAFYINKQGVPIVSTQNVPGATALTGQLVFKDQNGGSITGPVGSISSTDTANTPSLSGDGQSYNFTSPVQTTSDQTITLTWSDPNGKISNATADFVVSAVVLVASSVEFGSASPGTTA